MELDSASHKCGEKMAQHGSTLLANWEGNCLWAYAHYNLSHSSTIWCWSYSCISSTPSKMKNETVILSLSPNYFMESHQLLLHSSKWCSRTWHDQLEWTGQCKKDQVLKLGQGKKKALNYIYVTDYLNCGVGEDSWVSLGLQEIQPVHPEGDQSWVFIGRTDIEAEIPVLWPPPVKSWLIGRNPDAGRDLGQEEKGMIEDEMAGWHHRLHGHEFE